MKLKNETINSLLNELSYKTERGYPDLDDPKDIQLLTEIVAKYQFSEKDMMSEVGDNNINRIVKKPLLTEAVTYDDMIKHTLGKLVKPKGEYKLGVSTRLSGTDQKIFKMLYPVSAPKAGQAVDAAGTKGSGYGEIAMYWLLSKAHNVQDSRGGGDPDLLVDGKGLEVKSYDTARIKLGKFQTDKKSSELLNIIFGLNALVSGLTSNNQKIKIANVSNFNGAHLVNALRVVEDFSNNTALRTLANKYELIRNIYEKIDYVITALKSDEVFQAVPAAATFLRVLIITKFQVKPGSGGYVVNVSPDGDIRYKQINLKVINGVDDKTVLSNITVNSGEIILSFDAIFGK